MWSFLQVPPSAWAYPPPDFTITAQNSSFSIQAGQTVTDTITVISQNGFYGPVTVSVNCSAPALVPCSLSPSNNQGNFAEMMLPLEVFFPTLTIATYGTPSASSSGPVVPTGIPRVWLWTALIGLAACVGSIAARRKRAAAILSLGRYPGIWRGVVLRRLGACVLDDLRQYDAARHLHDHRHGKLALGRRPVAFGGDHPNRTVGERLSPGPGPPAVPGFARRRIFTKSGRLPC